MSPDMRRLVVSFFFQAEDGIRDTSVTGVQTCALPISDVWAVDARTGKASQLRKEARPSLRDVPEMETSITRIRAHDGLSIPINVYLPKNRSEKLPVIVSYHGGPSASARIRWAPSVAFFLSQGYAWVEPNVRGSGGFGRAFEE